MFLQAVASLLFTTVVLGHPKLSSSSIVDWYHIHETRMTANDVKYSLKDEQTAQYWENNAQDFINNKVANGINTNVAKNTIIFLGDGMSIPTLVAARIYKGQLENATGEESSLSFDAFPHSGLSKTYCVNAQVADSACTATAYLCGVKTNSGTIGVTANVTRGDCEAGANPDNHVYSIARWSQLQGKRTGLVTTTTVTHASPGGVYAHTANRDWESDTDVNAGGGDPQVCRDIAYQAVYGETGENLHVIFGGGRQNFLPKDTVDDEGTNGSRSDGIDLIEAWKEQQSSKGEAEYVWNKDQLLNISSDTDYVLGLFENGHMQYHLDANETSEPTLEEMTEAAIKVLSKGEKGFFLFVEGGRIDHGHHSTYAKKALDETVEFSKAIQKAVDMTSSEDTLIVVTSDHAHTLTVSGYPSRGNDILETAGTADDGLVYATLSYANGPGYHKTIESDGSRHDLSTDDMHDNNYEYPATVPLSSETHGGDDVGIFASGPWAHLLSGVVEQNVIPHVVAYASCVGNGTTACVVYRDIAYQAVYGETGENLNVILGGGRRGFLPSDVVDEEGCSGRRTDGLNLVQAWLDRQSQKGQAKYVWNREQLLEVANDTDSLLGLFEDTHIKYHVEGDKTEPTLEEMTEAAIDILSKGKDGFFLFVEGGRIDHGHHKTNAKKALDETVEFSKAIERALKLTSSEDTLIVVTSDHAHTFSVSGYPTRGKDIF